MKQYHDLVRHVLENGTRKPNRTGVDTLSIFNYNYEIDVSQGFPLLTTKKIDWKSVVVELLWFISGSTNISFLKKHKCEFWSPWADVTGEVASSYGNGWVNYPIHHSDQTIRDYSDDWMLNDTPVGDFNNQLYFILNELKTNPMSRRMVVLAWAPGNAQTSKLPPCHYTWVLNVQNKTRTRWYCFGCEFEIVDKVFSQCQKCKAVLVEENIVEPELNLHLTQRSGDVALGIPFNIASYSLLLHLFSRFSGIKVGKFAHSIVDAHIYTSKEDGSMAEFDHIPGLKTQLTREFKSLPTLTIDPRIKDLSDVNDLIAADLSTEELISYFKLENYNPHPFIKFGVAV